ncbi:DUF1653 domain-containing protein [Chitinimonas sp. BJB300]|uniref:DUF1653 domain-containing protein n=1 Tax=Chitinimonas sp. BJB300 TaxID=1559339 RepID=UPI000C0FF761|nr:DUF1653 domain-containing protein [Chitinimonas sp. BJB300]PHV09846.1 hypothetical protein CSQ89_19430 [Chitinimonas sp. BJB300]TSJ85616.1 DUF1653 domain-containing protein [Chitinimonas sp. BJB300]
MSDRYYRHMDGGLYRFVADAMSADTGNPVIVYEHLWPFIAGLWVRDREEFLARFQPIDANEVTTAQQGDRTIAQAAVNNAKAIRRAAKAT